MIYLQNQPFIEYEYWIPTKQIEAAFQHNLNMNVDKSDFSSKNENPNAEIAGA